MPQEPAEGCEFGGYSTTYLMANTANSPYMTTDFREISKQIEKQGKTSGVQSCIFVFLFYLESVTYKGCLENLFFVNIGNFPNVQ